MKFGVALPNFGKFAGTESIRKISVGAESLGFDSVWVSDHIVLPKGHQGFGRVFYEPLVTLSYVAALTSRVALGTSVLVLPYRNPLVLGKMLATIDVLSSGRLIVGVGVGHLEGEFHALGVPFEKRGAVTDEYIEVLKTLFTNPEPSFQGRHANFDGIVFEPLPEQKPRPPILVGGGGGRAIERAARAGDGWHPVGLSPAQVRDGVAYLIDRLEKEGRGLEGFGVYLRKNLEITDEDKGEDEPLRGSVEKITSGIALYAEAGVTHVIFQPLSGTLDGVLKTMEVFARDIRPVV